MGRDARCALSIGKCNGFAQLERDFPGGFRADPETLGPVADYLGETGQLRCHLPPDRLVELLGDIGLTEVLIERLSARL